MATKKTEMSVGDRFSMGDASYDQNNKLTVRKAKSYEVVGYNGGVYTLRTADGKVQMGYLELNTALSNGELILV